MRKVLRIASLVCGFLTQVTLLLIVTACVMVVTIIIVSYVWKSPETKGPAPEAFSYSAAVTKDGRIVTFGGVHNGSAGNDTHILNTGKHQM